MIYIYAVDWTRGKGRKWVLLLVVSRRIIFVDFSAFWMSDETLLHLAFDKLVKHQLKKLYELQEIVHIHAHVSPTVCTSPLEAYGMETLHIVTIL